MNQSFKSAKFLLSRCSNAFFDFVVPKKCFGCNQTHQPFAISNLCVFCETNVFNPKRYTIPHFSDLEIHAAGNYKDVLKKMVILGKFKKNILAVDLLSEFLFRLCSNQKIQADLITSVPSYFHRTVYRGIDLPGMLATQLSKKTKIPCHFDVVQKTKFVDRQNKLSQAERRKNVQNIFKVNPKYKNQSVILIDDILTTGSTVLACYKAFRKYKIKTIVLTAAKT